MKKNLAYEEFEGLLNQFNPIYNDCRKLEEAIQSMKHLLIKEFSKANDDHQVKVILQRFAQFIEKAAKALYLLEKMDKVFMKVHCS